MEQARTKRLERARAFRKQLTERQEEVVSGFLARASVQGERAVSRGRAVVAMLGIARQFAFYSHQLIALEAKAWLVFSSMSLAVVASVAVLARLRPETARPSSLVWTTLLDTFLTAAIVYPILIWPHEGYTGLLREPEYALLYLVAVSSGLRLSDQALAAGIGGSGLVLASAIALDHGLNSVLITYPVADIMLVGLFFIGSAVLGAGFSRYSRQLVRQGSLAALNAERARQQLGVYVSETVARSLDEQAPALGGERRPVAVLFSDLRGFTRYAEKRPPEALVAELNDYLDEMVTAIHAEGGLVDKYIGDAIMAVFGLDESVSRSPAVGAIRTAVAMQQTLQAHNTARDARGLTPLRQGIGVHFGPAVAGNIGTVERMQYTVLGDAVNTASRLEGATKTEDVSVLISAEVVAAATAEADAADLPALEVHGSLSLRGREGPLEVYRLARESSA